MFKDTKNPLDKERKTIRTMIQMFCRKFHNSKNNICEDCLELYEYANQRLNNCRYGKNKPTCEKCPIHCYRNDMRKKVRKVMRYAGPRMIYTHPVKGIRHLIKKIKNFEDKN